MKKRDANKDNLILFPGLGKRLLEKGLDYLKQQKYRDAIQCLEQALEHEPENSDIYVGLILVHYETGNLKQAKEIAAEMLRSGRGDYIQVIEMYLMILVQLNEYREVVTTIEGLLEDREIPPDKHEHFVRMLEFGRKMQDAPQEYETEEVHEDEAQIHDDEQEIANLFATNDINKQVMALASLTNVNIRPFIKILQDYLVSQEGHPFLKTMTVNILREQEYSEEIAISKFGWEESFTPAHLPDVKEYIEDRGVLQLLADEIENDDPVLYEQVQSLVERYFFLMYPFKARVGMPAAWAAAVHFIANEYYGFDDPLNEFANLYGSHHDEAAKVLEFIRELEEISYPII
ncbi:tetratricopeptide repeat protein [Bacillus sp. ISL-35]|uniref:tetratricopeptide repeat protein n=1 Tax=Bacillus sp. ISL-35 TaxID=2819122 RepID=UPI001BE65013|nr:tetratricopeptide repeat protein [Bacillus sp. ISL-35]MBT2681861.1 tetratricopeptide repeat protein [Bacillus sp. ISL-35]MBT2702338.1 tetratricopeptide repeat protein [Chryseobacterium sp. ISL-80]